MVGGGSIIVFRLVGATSSLLFRVYTFRRMVGGGSIIVFRLVGATSSLLFRVVIQET